MANGKVKIYRYKGYDITKDIYIIHEDRMATREYIQARRPLQIIESSETEVDFSELDSEGRFFIK